MSEASSFQDRYHVRFKGRRTTVTLDKILSQLIAAEFGVMPDRQDYHSTVQQWLQATLTDKLGQNVPGGNSISGSSQQRNQKSHKRRNPLLLQKR